ncbi:MAG: hypothetical protein HXO85_02600, partial [Selenomonas sp.]|nr:hypothetical protein [Selenomonas sp.]
QEYELFLYQSPKADMDDFLAREAALVRHTIHMLASRARLNVLPQHALPPRRPKWTLSQHRCAEEFSALAVVSEALGFSHHARDLLGTMFFDYAQFDLKRAQTAEMLTAAIFLFAEINGIDLTSLTELYHVLGSNKRSVNAAYRRMRETLGCVPFDPRYLSEEGFVTMLCGAAMRKVDEKTES